MKRSNRNNSGSSKRSANTGKARRNKFQKGGVSKSFESSVYDQAKTEVHNFHLKAKDFIDPSSFVPNQPILNKRQI